MRAPAPARPGSPGWRRCCRSGTSGGPRRPAASPARTTSAAADRGRSRGTRRRCSVAAISATGSTKSRPNACRARTAAPRPAAPDGSSPRGAAAAASRRRVCAMIAQFVSRRSGRPRIGVDRVVARTWRRCRRRSPSSVRRAYDRPVGRPAPQHVAVPGRRALVGVEAARAAPSGCRRRRPARRPRPRRARRRRGARSAPRTLARAPRSRSAGGRCGCAPAPRRSRAA